MRSISFGQDGDFSMADMLARYTADLGNALGNLLNRVLPFADEVPEKGASGPLEEELARAHRQGAAAAAAAFDAIQPTRALDAIWTVIAAANLYVDRAAPWTAKKKSDPARLATIVATLVEELDAISRMISPVLPRVADLIRDQLGLPPVTPEVGHDQWPAEPPPRAPGGKLHRGSPIFPRIEKDQAADLLRRFAPPKEPAGEEAPAAAAPAATAEAAVAPTAPSGSAREAKPAVSFDEFSKLDLRVGLVTSAERVKKKDKLLDLRVDTGDGSPRRIIAGIAASYAPEELVGRRVVVLCNLPPRDFGKGLVSDGMILAADAGGALRALTVDDAAPPGAAVR
jgi:methionyl-tRNA synthetase